MVIHEVSIEEYIKKMSKKKHIISIQGKIGLFTHYRVKVRGFPDTYTKF